MLEKVWTNAIKDLITEGLQEIAAKYGAAGNHPLSYHNEQHAQDVMDAAVAIAERAQKNDRVSAADVHLAKLAACYHDIEHESLNAEEVSATIVAEKMEQTNMFSADDINKVRAMILATAVHITEGKIVQAVSPTNYLTHIMADADLAALGRPTEIYWNRALALLKERNHEAEPSKQMLRAFIEEQQNLLGYYQPFTSEAAAAFPFHAANLEYVKGMHI